MCVSCFVWVGVTSTCFFSVFRVISWASLCVKLARVGLWFLSACCCDSVISWCLDLCISVLCALQKNLFAYAWCSSIFSWYAWPFFGGHRRGHPIVDDHRFYILFTTAFCCRFLFSPSDFVSIMGSSPAMVTMLPTACWWSLCVRMYHFRDTAFFGRQLADYRCSRICMLTSFSDWQHSSRLWRCSIAPPW